MIEFEIVADTTLGPRLADAFADVRLEPGDRTTTLRGRAPDRSRMYGVLAHLQDLGIDVVALSSRVVDDPWDDAADGPSERAR